MGHLDVCFGKVSSRVLCPLLNWIVCGGVSVELYEFFKFLNSNPLFIQIFHIFNVYSAIEIHV